MRTEMKSSPIVVGVDADPERRAALAWAADEARRRRRPLTLVHAQGEPLPGSGQDPSLPSWPSGRSASCALPGVPRPPPATPVILRKLTIREGARS
ncbi:universal stress protein [Streptomyces sp. E5N91]|uniref:universal stress protein n=1 Tax=Streptomyces sp. E5N91 TaxID=1851996 RepID=UPI000EF62E0B|nr:universal stress protein [Streptomyces sp. E5N91]